MQPFPWRSLLLWNLLIVLYGLPLASLALMVHEFGHVLGHRLVGLEVHGIQIGLPAQGGGVLAQDPVNLVDGVICSYGGVVLESVVAVIVLALAPRRSSLFKLALLIFSGFALIHALVYLAGGYYCSFGDFRRFNELFPHMR